MTRAVSSALAERGLTVREPGITVLKRSRFTPVLRYPVRPTIPGGRRPVRDVIVKGYFRTSGHRVFDVMEHLWTDGFRGTSTLTIAEPVAYVPDHELMIQGVAAGRSLYEHMTSPEAALPAVRATARWLVKLHRSGVADAPVWGTDEEIAKTTLYARTLAGIAPDIGPRVSDLAEGALAGIAAHSAGVVVPTHGDFQPKNIHVSGRRITVIDFDRFALADPARDVAHFIGQSLTMSYSRTGSFAEIGPWVEAFADAYATRSGAAVPATLPFFVVRTFLEILYYKLFVRPVKDASFVPVWLDESERWLTAGMR